MLLLLSLSLAASAADLPDLALSWRRGAGTLRVVVPGGEHLAPDAPVAGFLVQEDARVDLALTGARLAAEGIVFGVAPGGIDGELHLSLCEDGGTLCRWAEVQFSGTVSGRRGAVVLEGRALPAEEAPETPEAGHDYVADPDAAFADALARAEGTGARVLLDFGAPWCPPCNLMSAEVLHDPADAGALDGLLLLPIDADRPDSWTLKDRYAVGGYPTLVVVDAAGAEVGRQVGYAGEAALLDWLSEVRTGPTVTERLAAATSARAGIALAWALVREGDEAAARRALGQASAQLDLLTVPLGDLADPEAGLPEDAVSGPALLRVRAALAPDAGDLRALAAVETSREALLTWIWGARAPAEEDPVLAAALTERVTTMLPGADPVSGADLLWVLADLAPDPATERAHAAAGAALLTTAMTGDLDADRGHLSSLAQLHERAGDLGRAEEILAEAVAHWPDDFTWHHAQAGLLEDQGRLEEAETGARAALAAGYGDNRLRAAARLAGILGAQDRVEEAVAVIDAALDELPAPAEEVAVRTHRYRQALVEQREALAPR